MDEWRGPPVTFTVDPMDWVKPKIDMLKRKRRFVGGQTSPALLLFETYEEQERLWPIVHKILYTTGKQESVYTTFWYAPEWDPIGAMNLVTVVHGEMFFTMSEKVYLINNASKLFDHFSEDKPIFVDVSNSLRDVVGLYDLLLETL